MKSCTARFAVGRRDALRLGAAAALAVAIGGAGRASAAEAAPDALEVMQRDGRFSKWLDLISYTGLARYMTGEGGRIVSFTMFAPTDEAVAPYHDLIKELRLNTPFPDTHRVTQLIRSYTLPGLHPLAEFSGKAVLLHGFANNPVQLDGRNPKSSQLVVLVGAKRSKNTIDGNPVIPSNAIVYALGAVDLRMVYGW